MHGQLLCLLSSVGLVFANYQVNGSHCVSLSSPVCFNQTRALLPNLFNLDSVEDVKMRYLQFKPLIKIRCSAKVEQFFCAVHYPSCDSGNVVSQITYEDCIEVYNGCAPILEKFDFSWPNALRCEQFERSLPESTESTLQLPPGCYEVESEVCPNRKTAKIPNILGGSDTIEEASLELGQYLPLIHIECSVLAREFFCAFYLPSCDPQFNNRTEISNSMCLNVKGGCGGIMMKFGFEWPEVFDCDRFDTVESTSQPETDITYGECHPLNVPECSSRSCTTVNVSRQQELRAEFQSYNVGCSPQLQPFICDTYFPHCLRDVEQYERRPCQSTCLAAKRGCESKMEMYGFQWPSQFDCSSLPTDGECVVGK